MQAITRLAFFLVPLSLFHLFLSPDPLDSLTKLAIFVVPYCALLFFLSPSFVVHKKGVVLITGASSGIGRAAAYALAEKGYEVFPGVRKVADGEKLKELRSDLKNLHPIILDVVKSDQIQNAKKEIGMYCQNNNLPFVALVNNAGVGFGGPLEFYDMEKMKWLYSVNVFGLMETTKEFVPLLRNYKGRIVNIGSVAGLIGVSGSTIYAGTKWAVEGASECLRRELKPFGVSVSVINPAYIKTPHGEKGPETQQEYGEEATKLYNLAKHDVKRVKHYKHADTTDVTNNAIIHAITSKKPEASYVVSNVDGIPAKLIAFVKWLLPYQLFDFLTKS